MRSRWIAGLLSLCAAGLLAVPCAGAWEIRLRADVTVDAAVVRLGDVAELVGADPVTHAGIERVVLAPGPTPSHRRVLSGGAIRRALAYRGVDLETCRFTGPPAVVVFGRGAARDSGSPPGVVERARSSDRRETASESAARRLEQLLARRLETESAAAAWSVLVSFTDREMPRVPTDFRDVSIDGWPAAEHARTPADAAGLSRGRHALVACFDTDHGPVRVPFEATVQPLVRVVVPLRDVERGDVLRPTDLELRLVPDTDASGRHVGRLEDAVGRQTRHAARAGQPLESRSLVPPQLVRRRDTIEVSAARGAITVRRPVMALDDGTLGDTITVETMDGTKTRFLARVVGTRMAEVFVSSASAGRQMPQ